MEEAQLQYEKRDSITLKRNAKGEYAWDLKVYYESSDGDEDILERLKGTDAKLREAFLSGR